MSRALIHELTMPPIPNFDIPPSPPGTPPARTVSKFAHFLELKKQGVHFNEKLARSSALKNPSMLQKLMDFAGISDEDQYASALPKELWDPTNFPASAYKEELAKSQQEILRRREEEKKQKRQAVEFVPASSENAPQQGFSASTAHGDGDARATSSSGYRRPGAGGSGRGMSAAERVMAGLNNRDRTGKRTTAPRAP
jgi:hypothetical protein